MDAHVDLSCAQLQPILDAPGLAFRRNGKKQLARAIGDAAWWLKIHQVAERSRWVPSRDAKHARAAASALDRALKLLTEGKIPRGDLMAWAGDEADEQNPPASGAPSGFERAANVVEQICWLRDLLHAWARRTQSAPQGTPGRPDLTAGRLEAIEILAPAYKRAFGRRMARGRKGPTIRFLRAFFGEFGDRPHAATLVQIIRTAQRSE